MSNMFLRRVKHDDLDLLYQWANDSVVRNNSFNTDHISYINHVEWFNIIMSDSAVLQFILMDDDTPVGQIRLNVVNEEAEIGYSIGSEFRGQGYGHKILQLVADEVRRSYPEIKNLIAKVKPKNAASSSLFEFAGYEKSYICYTLKIES